MKENNKIINYMTKSYMPNLEQVRENCHRKASTVMSNSYSRQLVGLAVALVLIIGLSVVGVFMFGGGGDNVVSPNANGTADLSALSNHPTPKLVEITLEEAQTIIDYHNTYGGDFRYVGERIIENVQGEIKDPSVGLSSRVVEEAPYPEVYMFETDGSDFDGNHELVYYAVSKTGGILYVVESWTNTYGEDDVWVALTGGFVPHNESARLPELVIYDVSPTGLTLVLKNATDKEFMYGSDWQLLVLKGEEWEPVEVIVNDGMLAFTSEAYTAMPQSYTLKQNVAFEWAFGKLPTGEYKFVKGIMDFRGTGDYDDYELEQTFTIGEWLPVYETEDVQKQQLENWLTTYLTNSIEEIESVKVILHIPGTSNYVVSENGEGQNPQSRASIAVILKEGQSLTITQIERIYEFVQNSVDGLEKHNITLTDGDGILLFDNITESAIQQLTPLLNEVFGDGNYAISVEVDIDFAMSAELVVDMESMTPDEIEVWKELVANATGADVNDVVIVAESALGDSTD